MNVDATFEKAVGEICAALVDLSFRLKRIVGLVAMRADEPPRRPGGGSKRQDRPKSAKSCPKCRGVYRNVSHRDGNRIYARRICDSCGYKAGDDPSLRAICAARAREARLSRLRSGLATGDPEPNPNPRKKPFLEFGSKEKRLEFIGRTVERINLKRMSADSARVEQRRIEAEAREAAGLREGDIA
jgi:hypothetical protein